MPTGYTADQLTELERVMEKNTPPIPTSKDRKDAPRVEAMRAAGTDVGLLTNVGFKGGCSLVFFLNCVIAVELAGAITFAAREHKWRGRFVPGWSEHLMDPIAEDLASAVTIASLATEAGPPGMLVSLFLPEFGESGTTMVLCFPRRAALELATYIFRAGDTAKWWDGKFNLMPKHYVN